MDLRLQLKQRGDAMTNLRSICAILSLTMGAPVAAFGVDYSTYTDKDITVMSSGGADDAKGIAHNLHRLDRAITVVLGIKASDWRPPTQVYALPHAVLARVRGKKDDSLSVYIPTRFGNTILIDESNSTDSKLWGAYFGYTGSVLISAYSFRYPRWFITGLSEMFAASSMNSSSVTIGSATPARVYSLLNRTLVPVRTLLALHDGDPQLNNKDYLDLFQAESWLLVHLIVLEGKYHSNFFQYFLLRDRGEEEAKAFAASFDVSYEDLDKLLRDVLRAGKIETRRVAIPDEKGGPAAARLTGADAAARLAALAARSSVQLDDALQMANEAIVSAPKNQDALFARAHVQLRRADYAAALQAADRLCSLESLTQPGFAQCGQLYSGLNSAVLEKKAALDAEAPSLAAHSRQYYDRAITLDPEDLASWDGMAILLAAVRNPEYTRDFVPRAQAALSAHPRAGDLARTLSGLCADMGDSVMALNYAVMWQNAALSAVERDAAAAYVSRLRAFVERNNLRSTGGSH
jgi:tetratricopeptide (TPR) repeat protein